MSTSRLVVSLVFAALIASFGRAQVSQRRGETYDEYYTRKVRDETSRFRNNNPTFRGPGPSEKADWSSWNSLIESYNRRHGAPMPAPVDTAEKARQSRRADEQRAANAVTRQRIEADNAEVRAYNTLLDATARGDRIATRQLAERFESHNFPPGLSHPRNVQLTQAFWLYHRALENPVLRTRFQFFGLFPTLLAPEQYPRTAGTWLNVLSKFATTKTKTETLTEADARGDITATLVLGAWHQMGEIGFGGYEGPLQDAARLAEARRYYEKVAQRFPALGAYFLGTLDESEASIGRLFALADAPPPLPGDKDGLLTAMVRAHTRIVLALKILQRRLPGSTPATAAALLRDCAPADDVANAILGNLVFSGTAFDPIGLDFVALERNAATLSLQDGYEAYERLAQVESGPNPNGWYKGRALLLRGLSQLAGDPLAATPVPADPAAALRSFSAARAEFSNDRHRPLLIGDDQDLKEARARVIALEFALAPGNRARSVVDDLGRLENKVATTRAGIICARGAPGFPANPARALDFFTRALVIFKKGARINMAAYPLGTLRVIDVAEMADAMADLLRAHPEVRAAAVPVLRLCLPLSFGRSKPETYAFFAEYRLRGAPVADDHWEDSYKAAIVLQRQAADASPAFAGHRAEAAIRRSIEIGDVLERDIVTRLKALGDDPGARPWLEAYALEGAARAAALEKIPGATAQLLTRALNAHARLRHERSFASAFKAAQELVAWTTAGSLDACHLLQRHDAERRANDKNGNAERWFDAVMKPARSLATARLLEGMTAPEGPFYLQNARLEWRKALELGLPEARPALLKIAELYSEPLPSDPAFRLAREKQTTDRAAAMTFLIGMPDDFWRKQTHHQIPLVCAAMEQAGKTALIPIYLNAEKDLVSTYDGVSHGRIAFLTARSHLKGWGGPVDLKQSREFFLQARKQAYMKDGIDPAAIRELEQMLRDTEPRENLEPEVLRLLGTDAAGLAAESEENRARLFAWATGPEANAEPRPGSSAGSTGTSRRSTRVLGRFMVLGYAPAHTELMRRANAGELDARQVLAAILLKLSYANAPAIAEQLDRLAANVRDRFINISYEHSPGPRSVMEHLAKRHHGIHDLLGALSALSLKYLTAERPYFIDPPEGDSWTIRLLREHVTGNPGAAELLYRAALAERFARIEDKHSDDQTLLEAFRWDEFNEQLKPIDEAYMKLLRQFSDPVSLALALDRELPDDKNVNAGRGFVVEMAQRLAQIEPASRDPLLIYCRFIAHRALRRIAADHLPAVDLLESEAKAGHTSAQAEMGIFLAISSSANAATFLPLLEKSKASGGLEAELGNRVAAILARWVETTPDRPRAHLALRAFLQRVAPAELGQAKYFRSDPDYADFRPDFPGDKPPRDSEVIRLLKKAAAAGDAEATALLAER